MKRGAFPRLRFHPNAPPMPFDNFFANGKADTCAGVLVAGVQPLENHEDAVVKLRIDTDSVVRHPKMPEWSSCFTSGFRGFFQLGANMDARRLILAAEFDGIVDQILQQLRQ